MDVAHLDMMAALERTVIPVAPDLCRLDRGIDRGSWRVLQPLRSVLATEVVPLRGTIRSRLGHRQPTTFRTRRRRTPRRLRPGSPASAWRAGRRGRRPYPARAPTGRTPARVARRPWPASREGPQDPRA